MLLDRAAGICLPPHQRRLGYVFQDARLFPHLNVAANLDYGTRYAPAGGTAMSRDDVIDLLGLTPCWTAARAICQAARPSASPSAAPCCRGPRCC